MIGGGDVDFALRFGNNFPFDASDAWWCSDDTRSPPPPVDWAHSAARAILADLQDRRGIKERLVDIDEDVRKEVVESFAKIIRRAKELAP